MCVCFSTQCVCKYVSPHSILCLYKCVCVFLHTVIFVSVCMNMYVSPHSFFLCFFLMPVSAWSLADLGWGTVFQGCKQKTARCSKIRCELGNLQGGQGYVKITLQARLWESTLLQVAHPSATPLSGRQSDHIPSFSEFSDPPPPRPPRLPPTTCCSILIHS